jgi:hypothetical protein
MECFIVCYKIWSEKIEMRSMRASGVPWLRPPSKTRLPAEEKKRPGGVLGCPCSIAWDGLAATSAKIPKGLRELKLVTIHP